MNARIAILACALCLGAGIGIGRLGTRSGKPELVSVLDQPATSVVSAATAPALAPRMSPPPRDALALIRSGQPDDLADAMPLMRQLTLAECKEAWRLLARVQGNVPLLDAVARRWAELAPSDAFDAALRETNNNFRQRLGQAAARALVQTDPEAALERVSASRTTELRRRIAFWVLPELAKTNPTRVAEFLSEHKPLRNDQGLLGQIAAEYGRLAPEAALNWAGTLETAQLRETAIKQVWHGWAKDDPAAAAARIPSLTDSKHLADIYGMVANSWGRSDPVKALAWIDSIPDGDLKGRAYASFEFDLAILGKDGARNLISSMRDERRQQNLANRMAQQVLAEGLPEALAWVESLPAGKARENALHPVIHAWSETEPAEAARYLAANTSGFSNPMRDSISRWAQMEPDAAFAFAQQFSGADRDLAIQSAINGIRGEDPEKALQWMGTVQDQKVLGEIGQELIGSLVKSNPEKAKQIASSLPTEAQPRAFQGLIRNWAFEHATEAGNWIHTLPEGKPRDAAIKAYVSVIDGMDARLATHWARSIQEPEERAETFINVFHRWRSQDRQAADAWYKANPMPDDPFRALIDKHLKQMGLLD